MPHQCTTCGHAFADGSKDMLGGCPDCGGNKFQFFPEGTELPDEPPTDAPADDPAHEHEGSSVASTVGRATTRVRDFVSGDATPVDGGTDAHDDFDTDDGFDTDDDTFEATDGDGVSVGDDEGDDSGVPDPSAPWPDSSDAADPIRKGGFVDSSGSDGSAAHGAGSSESDIIDADVRATHDAVDDAEDLAQSDARSSVASDAEVAAAGGPAIDEESTSDGGDPSPGGSTPDADLGASGAPSDRSDGAAASDRAPDGPDGRVVSEPTGEEPDVAELREQLNDQFESIKIIEPGQYELNLMELYDREEYIIALQENGRYVIQVPEQWMGEREDR